MSGALYKKFAIAYIRGMPTLENSLRMHRARLALTQEELAERVGVRRQTILAIEKRRYLPSALLAFQLARALGIGVDELFRLVEEDAG
jgi:putative transcriptional regulator